MQNNGAAAGHVVDHLHFHVIPRAAGDAAVRLGTREGGMITQEEAEPVLAAMGTAASLHDVAQAIVRQIVEQRQKVPWLRRTWLRLALTDPEVDAVQRRLDAEWEERVAGIVTGVVEAGLADMPPAGPAAVATVIRVLVDAVADEVVLAGTISAEDAAGTVADLLTALLHNRAPEA